MSTLELLFSFKGRIGRKLFWLGTVLPACIVATPVYYLTDTQTYFYILNYSIVSWIGVAGCTKRLHDINQSGWIQLMFYIPAAITFALSFLNYDQQWVITSGYISFLIGLWISIKVALQPGILGQNKFSENTNLYSFNILHSVNCLKGLIKRIKWPQKETHSINHNDHKSLEIDTADSSLLSKTPDVLSSWLNNASANQIPKDAHLDENPNKTSKIPGNYSSTVEPEILQATNSIFATSHTEKTSEMKKEVIKTEVIKTENQPALYNETQSTSERELNNSKEKFEITTYATLEKLENKKSILENKVESFLKVLQNRATNSPTHQLYLQNSAKTGNSWAKLEISATWLSNPDSDQDQAQRAINYLNELANSSQSHLGAETEACYFLGEIYRIGFRYTHPNEDLSFKYLIRAAALGHKTAQHNLAKQLVHTANLENKSPLCLSLINNALQDRESSHALLQLIEFDWSITYIESVELILRTLVDQGNGQAARFLGRIFLEQSDYETAASILDLADTLDDTTINKIIDIINNAQISGLIINSLVDIVRKHARLNNSYANYQIALAFSEGIGLPQDKMMAFVHVTIASARVYGQERDRLIKLRDELHETLTKEEVTAAQEIIRRNYIN